MVMDYIDVFLGISTLVGAAIILIAAITVLVTILCLVIHVRNKICRKYYYKQFEKEWSEKIIEAAKEENSKVAKGA